MKPLLWSFLAGTILFFNQAFAQCESVPGLVSEILHCKSKLEEYPLPVHFYIPAEASSNYLLHFHGHNLSGYSHFDKRWGNYGSYLAASDSKAVLVIPESEGKCATYDDFFSDPARTFRFLRAVEKEISGHAEGMPALRAISGHSGAYRVLNRLAGYSLKDLPVLINLKAVGFFDATYGATPEVQSLVKTRKIFLYNAFVTGAKATAEDLSRKMMRELKEENVYFVPVESERNESVLDQHFLILKRGSLEEFFSKASAL